MFGGLNNIKNYEQKEEMINENEENNSNEDNDNKDNENDNNYLSIIGYLYKKIFKLVNKMNTNKAKEMAEDKYKYMLQFLKEFYKENGEEDKIENADILKENIINEKIEEYANKINKELLYMIDAEREREEKREKIKNLLENKNEKENIEKVFKVERAQAKERIQRKKEQCDNKIKKYIENKMYEEKEKKN